MLTIRMVRVVSGIAALAVSLIGLLPTAHVHADDDQQVVHQHAIADGSAHPDDHSSAHDAGVDQPDHTAARILTLSYDVTSLVTVLGPSGIARGLIEPALASNGPRLRTAVLPTHDPPLRFSSAPAPPAVV